MPHLRPQSRIVLYKKPDSRLPTDVVPEVRILVHDPVADGPNERPETALSPTEVQAQPHFDHESAYGNGVVSGSAGNEHHARVDKNWTSGPECEANTR